MGGRAPLPDAAALEATLPAPDGTPKASGRHRRFPPPSLGTRSWPVLLLLVLVVVALAIVLTVW